MKPEEIDEWRSFDTHFRHILHQHLTVLGWWSILNGVGGLIGWWILTQSAYYFWMMCGVWGIVNFAVAISFFYHTLYQKLRKGSAYERLVVQNHVERMLSLNIGIDTAYIFIGFWLRERHFICHVSYPDLWLGFGWAIIMQGLFLLVQDITFFCLYRRNFLQVLPFFEPLL